MWMIQAVCVKNSKKETTTQRTDPSPQLTVKTNTHPRDRNMDVGTCLPDNSAKSFPLVTGPHKSLPYTLKIAGDICCKQMTPRYVWSIFHPTWIRHGVLANMSRNPTRQYKDA